MPGYESHLLFYPDLWGSTDIRQVMDNWAATHKNVTKIHEATTQTTTGVACYQPMITSVICAANWDDALAIHKDMESDVADLIMRSKLEGLSLSEQPCVTGDEYYEFHVKVTHSPDGSPIDTARDWAILAGICLRRWGVPLLYNPCSDRPEPVTTMRLYDMTNEHALHRATDMVHELGLLGYKMDRMHTGYSKYDDNSDTDLNWLWVDDHKRVGPDAGLSITPRTCKPPAGWSRQTQASQATC